MEGLSKIVLLLFLIMFLIGCWPGTEDKYFITDINFVDYEDIYLSNDSMYVKTFDFNLNDTNKYVLMTIHTTNQYHFSSSKYRKLRNPLVGYRGPSDTLKSINCIKINDLMISDENLFDHYKFKVLYLGNSSHAPLNYYTPKNLINSYKHAAKTNSEFDMMDNLKLIIYKDALRKALKQGSSLELITNKRKIVKKIEI